MDVKAFLKSLPAFGQLADEHLDRLAKLARFTQFKSGEMVDFQGEPAEKFYILVSGRYGVVLDLDIGVAKRSYMVTSVGPGQMFAWSGMVGNPTYTAGGRTMTDCTMLEFDSAELNKAFDDDPKLGLAVMRAVAQTIASRLRHMQLQLVQQYVFRESEE
jgi:CRP-like cAMP-binding protein